MSGLLKATKTEGLKNKVGANRLIPPRWSVDETEVTDGLAGVGAALISGT